jgi:hypothetical protein
VGSCGEDTRQMTHSRKSATQRQKSLERLRTFRDRKVEEPMAAVHPVRAGLENLDRSISGFSA